MARSVIKTCEDGPCSRCRRRRARISSPCIGWTLGEPFFALWTCNSISAVVRYSRGRTEEFKWLVPTGHPCGFPRYFASVSNQLANYQTSSVKAAVTSRSPVAKKSAPATTHHEARRRAHNGLMAMASRILRSARTTPLRHLFCFVLPDVAQSPQDRPTATAVAAADADAVAHRRDGQNGAHGANRCRGADVTTRRFDSTGLSMAMNARRTRR